MIGANRGEAVRGFVLCALVVSNTEESLIDQSDDGGEDVLTFEGFALQIGAHPAPKRGKGFTELDDAAELRFLPFLPEARMVEVLSATLLVDAENLERRSVGAGDADVLPGGGNAQSLDAREEFALVHRSAR